MLSLIALFCLLLAAAADAQPVPAGSGMIVIKEKLAIGSGCGSLKGAGPITLSILPGGTWELQSLAFDLSGTLSPADPDGRSWNLQFDGPSLALYELYLEDIGSFLCDTNVSISDLVVETFAVKLGKDGTQVSVKVTTSATGSTAFGVGRGKHQIKGKGSFAPAP